MFLDADWSVKISAKWWKEVQVDSNNEIFCCTFIRYRY